jgi:hypothetical protein
MNNIFSKEKTERIQKVLDTLRPFLPKEAGILVYDKNVFREEDIKNILISLLELRWNKDISLSDE